MSEKNIKSVGCSKPIRMWIDGKCFNLKRFKRHTRKILTPSSDFGLSEEPDNTVNTEEINYDVDATGKISINFELPSLYYAKLKHNDFYDLNLIKSKTNTHISIPNPKKSGNLTISGDNEPNLKIALNEIHSVIGDIRNRAMVLQFIAIPLLSDEIKSNFEHFKNEVLEDKDTTRGLDESIFISALKLHLTVCVLVLLNDREKQEAIKTLEEYNENILKPLIAKSGPLKIHVAGVDIFDDQTCEKVDVLFAKAKIINETNDVSLQRIANSLSEYFYEKGLLKRHEENVKLHMTLINTKYRRPLDSSPKRRWVKRESLDATKIMEKYREYEFGTCDLKAIHLSNISSEDEDGFYQNLATIVV